MNDKKEKILFKQFFQSKRQNDSYNFEEQYDGIIEVPVIKLKKGFFSMNSKYNNVKYGIEIIKGSLYPDTKNSNLILASHSGSGNKSYFTNLDVLKNNDIIIVYYNNVKYTYEINSIFETLKKGEINLPINTEKAVTLITCNKKNRNNQIVIIGKIVKEEPY